MIVRTAPKSSSEANPERGVHNYLGSSDGSRRLGRALPNALATLRGGSGYLYAWATPALVQGGAIRSAILTFPRFGDTVRNQSPHLRMTGAGRNAERRDLPTPWPAPSPAAV